MFPRAQSPGPEGSHQTGTALHGPSDQQAALSGPEVSHQTGIALHGPPDQQAALSGPEVREYRLLSWLIDDNKVKIKRKQGNKRRVERR